MNKGIILYVGNFELPDKGASANRVMTNRLLFREIGYRTAYLGVTKESVFNGIRKSSFDNDVYERAYPFSIKMWLERSYSLKDIIAVVEEYKDVKIIIFYNSPISLVKKAYSYFKKKEIKVLYDCTEWKADTEGNRLKQLYKKYDAHQIQHCLEKYVDGLIVISSMMYQQYQTKPKVLIPPLIDIDDPMWRQERTRNDDIFEFCYAGDPGRKDDLSCLIDAYKGLDRDNNRLLIIGLKKEEFLKAHPEYRIVVESIRGQIHFMGRVSREEVIRRLINTDCFVFIRESNLRNNAGFPTKFTEAYTSGVQIIATDISDIQHYKQKKIQVLRSKSVTSITKAMSRAMEMERAETIREAFDYRNYVKMMKEFIELFSEETKRKK